MARRPSAVRMPICAGVASRTSIAVSGRARKVIWEPKDEVVWPAHSLVKSLWRHSPENRNPMAEPRIQNYQSHHATANSALYTISSLVATQLNPYDIPCARFGRAKGRCTNVCHPGRWFDRLTSNGGSGLSFPVSSSEGRSPMRHFLCNAC